MRVGSDGDYLLCNNRHNTSRRTPHPKEALPCAVAFPVSISILKAQPKVSVTFWCITDFQYGSQLGLYRKGIDVVI